MQMRLSVVFMYYILQGMSEGDDEQESINKGKLFIRKVADIIPKVCGSVEDTAKAKTAFAFQLHLWHDHFHVLNNLKNTASLNNLLLLKTKALETGRRG